MPIRWSALRLSRSLDNIEELQVEAERYLEPTLIFAKSAKDIDNLPEYM